MNNASKLSEITKALIEGGEAAVEAFFHLTGGECFPSAPEYFLTTHAALAFSEFNDITVELEASVKETRTDARATGSGRHSKQDRPNGRYDLILHASDAENVCPWVAVEVKSHLCDINTKLLEPDFERLCKTLSRGSESSFDAGIFLFYASVGTRIDLPELLNGIEKYAENLAGNHDIKVEVEHGPLHDATEECRAWCIACVIFTRKSV